MRASRARHGAVVEALVDAYEEDPVMNWAFRAGEKRHAGWAAYFRLNVERYALFDGVFVAEGNHGAALWAPPGRYRVGWRDEISHLPEVLTMLGVGRLRRGLALMRQLQAHHPQEPHWYLNIMGVRRQLQGRGIGGALMRAGLALVDADRLGAYLESSHERNLPLYSRHGFQTQGELELAPGVRIWRMWRAARP